MAIPASIAKLYEAGDAWLTDCAPHPSLVRAAWEEDILAPIPSGPHWLLVRTQLVAAVYSLERLRDEQRGPVLAFPKADAAWWLVPPEGGDALAHIPGMHVRPSGRCLHCPPTGWQLEGRFWLCRPDGSGRLTDPAALAAVFGAGRYRHAAEAKA
jgi:hypothetical protein